MTARSATFPRDGLPVVREGNFSLPMLDSVALVGNEPLVEMMFSTPTLTKLPFYGAWRQRRRQPLT